MVVFKAYFVCKDFPNFGYYSPDIVKGYKLFKSDESLASIKKKFLLFIYNSTKETIERTDKIYATADSLAEELEKYKEEYLASKRDFYQVKKKVAAFVTLNGKNKDNPYEQLQQQLEDIVKLKYKKVVNNKKKLEDYNSYFETINNRGGTFEYVFKIGDTLYIDKYAAMVKDIKNLLSSKSLDNLSLELSFLLIKWLDSQPYISRVNKSATAISDISSEYWNNEDDYSIEEFNNEPEEGSLRKKDKEGTQ